MISKLTKLIFFAFCFFIGVAILFDPVKGLFIAVFYVVARICWAIIKTWLGVVNQ